MKKTVQISIPEPCHENWAKMTPADKGRFCASCQKNVIDFTRSSDREISSALGKEAGLCGRFLPSQLERDLSVPEDKSHALVTAAAVLAMMALGTAEMGAQTPVQTEDTLQMSEVMLGKVAMPAAVITGTITDSAGPLPGVLIAIEGSTVTTQTDFDGNYSIEARPGFTLVYSFPGYTTQKRLIDSKAGTVDIEMHEEELVNEVITNYRNTMYVVGKPLYIPQETLEKKRTFFGRIFHKIGNLFR